MNDLASRIEAAYMRRTGKPSPHGARAWFARQAKVRPGTVSRWLTDRLPFSGPPLAVLELLESGSVHTIRDTLELEIPDEARRVRDEEYVKYLEKRGY